MKKLFLLFFVTCFCCDVTFAQDNSKNLEYCNAKLDSVILEYSIDTNKNPSYRDVYNFNNANLTDADKQKIIARIRSLFEQEKYSNLYYIAHEWIYKMWYVHPKENSTKVKQLLLELNLQYYFYPNGYDLTSIDFSDLSIKKNYTKRIKKRILEILKDEKTQKEYNAWLLCEKSIPGNKRACESLAQWIINHRKIKNDTIIEWIKDSVCTEYISNEAKRMLAETKIQPNLILMAGFLGMKECIPTMQKNLQAEIVENKYHSETEIAYRLALAKLGDKEQYQYILDTFIPVYNFAKMRLFLSDNKFLLYFKDDKITWQYIDTRYLQNKNIQVSSYSNIPISLYTMDVICPYIKDLPKELKNPYDTNKRSEMEDFNKWEKLLYEWIVRNRDSIKFNYDINDGWFWSD